MAIDEKHGFYICDYCGEDTGKFNDETGNHDPCEKLASLREKAIKASSWLALLSVYAIHRDEIMEIASDLMVAANVRD